MRFTQSKRLISGLVKLVFVFSGIQQAAEAQPVAVAEKPVIGKRETPELRSAGAPAARRLSALQTPELRSSWDRRQPCRLSALQAPTREAREVVDAGLADYVFFDDTPMPEGYWYSSCESTGAGWVRNIGGKLPVRKEPAYTPGSSLELSYATNRGGTWKVKLLHRPVRGLDAWDNGVFIQSTPTPFKRPEFLHMRVFAGDTPASSLPNVRLLLDKDQISKPVSITDHRATADAQGWSLVSIPIAKFECKVQAAEQVHGLLFEPDATDDGKEHKIFLDQIDLRPIQLSSAQEPSNPEIISVKGYERHVDISWKINNDSHIEGTIVERSTDGTNFVPVGYRRRSVSRFADYLLGREYGTYHYRIRFLGYDDKRSLYSDAVSAATKPFSDDELLDMAQEACARMYWDGAEPNSGMTLESVPGSPHMVATGASGFGIMALVVAAHRNFIPRKEVAERMLKIVDFLERADRFHGVWAHYMDGRTGHPVLFFGPDDNGGDLVETSFLMQGLLTARQFFDGNDDNENSLRDRITKLWEGVEWDWYRKTPDNPYLVWHWSPDKEFKINHNLIGWNESMITYLLAIASPTHPVPASMYYSGWASQERSAQQYRGDGSGKMYSNGDVFFGKKLDVGGFSGGPIFFTHYNFLGLNPHGLCDRYTEYFENSKTICEINLRYCQANPAHHQGYGDAGWGLTASDGPMAYNPDEPRPEGDKGKLTPTGALASMPYLPNEAMAVLGKYYRDYGSFLWGEYGFRDAFSLDDRWVNDLYMGLNQAPMVVMIENHRTGLPWKLFGSNPEIQKARKAVFQ